MNGFCKTLGCFFGPQFNPSDDTWAAIQVYRDGNVYVLCAGFETEEEAEAYAGECCAEQIIENSHFGVGA